MVTQFYGVILRSGVRETTLSTECLASGNTFFLFSSKFNGTLFFPLPETQHPRLGLLPLPFATHNRAAQCGPDSILTLAAAAYACSLSVRVGQRRQAGWRGRIVHTDTPYISMALRTFWVKTMVVILRWAVGNPASYSPTGLIWLGIGTGGGLLQNAVMNVWVP